MSEFDGQRKWTVRELITHLETMPENYTVTLLDQDTNYIIELFSVTECLDNEVTFFPCGYMEMRK